MFVQASSPFDQMLNTGSNFLFGQWGNVGFTAAGCLFQMAVPLT